MTQLQYFLKSQVLNSKFLVITDSFSHKKNNPTLKLGISVIYIRHSNK